MSEGSGDLSGTGKRSWHTCSSTKGAKEYLEDKADYWSESYRGFSSIEKAKERIDYIVRRLE